MKKFYIKVSSITHAMKGRDVLVSRGYRAAVRRNLKPQRGDEGCGYSIYIDERLNEAVEILRSKNVNVLAYGDVSDFR